MPFTLEYTSTVRGVTYALTAVDDGTSVDLELTGRTATGDQVATGAISLPAGSATPTVALFRRALSAIADFEAPSKRLYNANARWTPEADTTLRDAWLAHSPTTPAAEAIRTLAATHSRTTASIRARLPRVNCDPDVPGRSLTPEAAELVARGGPVGSILIADVEAPSLSPS